MTHIEPAVFRQAAERAASWLRPLLLTHARPDGDAIGSLLAMRSILRGRGAQPLAVLLDPVPHAYRFLVEGDPPPVLGHNLALEGLSSTDGILVLDTCTYEQLLPLAEWLRASRRPIIALDHHVTRDLPAELHLIDTSASAAALLVWEWARTVNWSLNDEALTCLFIGMATDTGWFRFSNTDARTLDAAAELLRRGVNAADLYDRLYNNERPAKIKLAGAALSTLELFDRDRIACMQLDRAALECCAADPADTEGIINEAMRIGTVEASILLVEQPDGVIRVSLRSRKRIDVASIAVTLGGGGHPRAAGARMPGPLAEAKQRVLKALQV